MSKAFTLLFALASIWSYGQFSRGDKFVGGTVQFSRDHTSNYTDVQLNIDPAIGFLINEKTAIGFGVGYGHQLSSNSSGTQPATTSTSVNGDVNLFVKRFFFISDYFAFGLAGSSGFLRGRDKLRLNNGSQMKTNSYAISASLNASFIFFPTPRWGFEVNMITLAYNYDRSLSNDQTSNDLRLTAGLSYGLTLNYYFRK